MRMRNFISIALFVVAVACVVEGCTTYAWVRATGDWTVDADNGQTAGKQLWQPDEPLGLMNLEASTCLYKQQVSHLVSGRRYEWKVTIGNSWSLNYGCYGQNQPNCAFTAGLSGVQVFIFDPQTNTLSTQSVSSSTPSPTTKPISGPTPGPTVKPTTKPTSGATAKPTASATPPPVSVPTSGSGKQVFAHFMMGNTYGYDQNHFASDMSTAKALGIDAFALNIGTDTWTFDRVNLAYAAANSIGFKLFLSFDMSFYSSTGPIISGIVQTANLAAQYKYNNNVFVSTFGGAGVNMGYSSANAAWTSIKNSLSSQGINIFFVPNFAVDANTIFTNNPSLDGALSWGAWPSPNVGGASALTAGDNVYMRSANSAGKVYLAPVSPWFFTHLSYKNYIYQTNALWWDRWQQILNIKPHMIEIITWNDWGEAHYIGSIDSNSNDLPAGSQDYVYGFPHTAWLDTLPYFITAYKTGTLPTVTTDTVVYWYRPFLASSVAPGDKQPYVSNQDTSPSSATPAQVLTDQVFVITILKSSGTIQVKSGSSTVTQAVPAGAYFFATQMNTGTQTVALLRNSVQVCTNTGSVAVGTNPTKYNYNAYVGGCKA